MSTVVNFHKVVAVAGGFPVLAGLDIEIAKGENNKYEQRQGCDMAKGYFGPPFDS